MEYNFTFRDKDDTIQVILSYKDTNGKWHQRSKQGFKKQRDAKKAGDRLLEYVKENQLHIVSGSRHMTFDLFAEMFIEDIKNTLEFNTIRNYQQAIEAFADLKSIPIKDIQYADINTIYNNMDYKTSTANLYMAKLRTIFSKAVKPYKILKVNPTDDIVLRQDKTDKKNNALTSERLKKLLDGLKATNYNSYVVVNIAAYAGLRIGEILGLRRTDIDLNARTITVERQHVLKAANDFEKRSPKSKNSYRLVPIPKELSTVLEIYKDTTPANIDGYMFHGVSNSGVNNFIRKVDKGISIHKLRHTYATTLLGNGVDIKTVAALLGDTVETVIKTYVHYNDDMREKAAKSVDKIFFGGNF